MTAPEPRDRAGDAYRASGAGDAYRASGAGDAYRASGAGDRTEDGDFWDLRLYIAGQTPKCLAAFANLKRFCEENLAGKYRIEVIDLHKDPKLAQTDQILAIPTLVRKLPAPMRKFIGDLSDARRVLAGIEPRPKG